MYLNGVIVPTSLLLWYVLRIILDLEYLASFCNEFIVFAANIYVVITFYKTPQFFDNIFIQFEMKLTAIVITFAMIFSVLIYFIFVDYWYSCGATHRNIFAFSINGYITSWTDDSNWESSFDNDNNNSIKRNMCKYGLECDDDLNHTINLEYIDNNLNRTTSDSIENLSHLKTLVFAKEFRLFETIPQTICNVTSIEAFVLNVSISDKISSNIIKWQDNLLGLSWITTQLNDSLISSHPLWQSNNLSILDLQINFNLTAEISNNFKTLNIFI